jgi:hypothetical protein
VRSPSIHEFSRPSPTIYQVRSICKAHQGPCRTTADVRRAGGRSACGLPANGGTSAPPLTGVPPRTRSPNRRCASAIALLRRSLLAAIRGRRLRRSASPPSPSTTPRAFADDGRTIGVGYLLHGARLVGRTHGIEVGFLPYLAVRLPRMPLLATSY